MVIESWGNIQAMELTSFLNRSRHLVDVGLLFMVFSLAVVQVQFHFSSQCITHLRLWKKIE